MLVTKKEDMSKYSQRGQDDWVLNIAKHKYYVDIGAADGVSYSNTCALENLGWEGICVEAEPIGYQILSQNRKCIKINKAVWKENGTIDFLINEGGEMLSGIPLCFSDMHSRHGPYCFVSAITLNDLLKENNTPKEMGYLSLDTEGSEFEILNAFDFSYKFDCITLEHNWVEPKRTDIRNLLISKGYKFLKEDEEDDYYVREDIDRI